MKPKKWTKTWGDFLLKSTSLIKEYIQKERSFLLDNIADDSIILDIGCGFGEIINLLADKTNRIIGIDINNETLQKAIKNNSKNKNAEFFNENCTKTHFPDSYFDSCIFGMNTFGNLDKDKVVALKETIRITKNKGRIFISVYSEHALRERLKSYSNASILNRKIIDKNKGVMELIDSSFNGQKPIISEQFSKEDLTSLCRNVGQTNISIESLNKVSYICIVNVEK